MPPFCEKHQIHWSRDNDEHQLRCFECHDEARRAIDLEIYDRSRLAWQTSENHMKGAALVFAIEQAGGVVRVPRVALEDPGRHMARLRTAFDHATNDLVLSLEVSDSQP
jgi:hypothetical protein